MNAPTPREADLVVVGTGIAGLTAAVTGAARGLSVLVLEKSEQIGGTSALSGGAVWVPNNHHMPEVGRQDSFEQAMTYLDRTVGNLVSRELKTAFLTRGPEAVRFVEANSRLRLSARRDCPDYLSDREGASLGGRIMDPPEFDGRELGERFRDLRSPRPEFGLFGKMMVNRADIEHLLNARSSPRSAIHAARLLIRYASDRLRYPRGTRLLLGNALIAALYKSVLEKGIPVLRNSPVRRLLHEGGRVVGVEFEAAGQRVATRARRGVVLATGGFPNSPELRRELIPMAPEPHSAAAETGTGDGIRLARSVGAKVQDTNSNPAFWSPVSLGRRSDGSVAKFPHLMFDRQKPGLIAVNRAGVRFTNEAESYHEFVKAMLDTRGGVPCSPAYLICDHRFVTTYTFGLVRPTAGSRRAALRSGYLRRGDTIEQLAGSIGLDPEILSATVARYNDGARSGEDPEFGRGKTAYHRYLGDAGHLPNPCVAPIETGPFYAIEVVPGDIGTATGLATDANARVLDESGQPIPGLYACGNDMNSVMGGEYPGPGITLGPNLTFGYVAATHAAEAAAA